VLVLLLLLVVVVVVVVDWLALLEAGSCGWLVRWLVLGRSVVLVVDFGVVDDGGVDWSGAVCSSVVVVVVVVTVAVGCCCWRW